MSAKDDLRDGFGHSVDEQIATSGSIALMYGTAPEPWQPIDPFPTPPVFTPPIVPPAVVIQQPKPDRYTVTCTGPNGVELTVALTADEWAKVKAAILEALR